MVKMWGLFDAYIGTERTITDGMTNLSNYYQLNIRLCQPRKGNEKGHVERSVEFIRRKAFAPGYTFASLEEAKQHLSLILQQLNERLHHQHKIKQVELMKKEKGIAKPANTPFDVADVIECRVDKYSTVAIKQNHYSVPEGHVGKYIKAKVGADHIGYLLTESLPVGTVAIGDCISGKWISTII
ncbi:hypothetical protein [Virgibacillus sp. YIM 98842]|uniref:Mu transposase domain-containing protein n=1 Tax=Virgibacillus sp. YIM 98842 TaxID=2663533 RepID=UPI0013DB3B82|nr:hypothetical protein [Virgibacillus sp. YIM 98842]